MKTIPPNDKLLSFFQRALDVNHAVYGLGIDVLAAYSPLLATLIPAWMMFENTSTHLGFPVWVALAAAVVVEVLGISAVHTTVSFWQFNSSLTRKGDLRSPFWVALGTSIAYIVIVLIVNTVLDAASGETMVNVIAGGTLSLLSLVGALIVAVRAQHALRLTGNDPASVQVLNEKLQVVNEKIRALNEQNRELNARNERLNKENGDLNAELIRLNGWGTLLDESVDAAERIRRAAELLPGRSQNTLADVLNISKSYVSQVFTKNGFHRIPTERE